MILDKDLDFHEPQDGDHEWAETYWLGFYVPEENLYGWIYMVFRHGIGVMTCDVEFIDRKSRHMFDAKYVDIQHNIPLPASLRQFTLSNGLSFSATSLQRYRVDYIGVDSTEVHLDFEGIHEPFDIHDPEIDPMAQEHLADAIENSGFGTAYANHFDLTMRATGTVMVRGKTYQVNSLATNDHSWGPRGERGMRTMAYMNAHFPGDYVVQTIWEFDPSKPDGEQHIFKHGYAVVGGRLLGGIDARLRVKHSGIFPETVELAFTDKEGLIHRMTASPSAFHHWLPYGCCPTGHSMLKWVAHDGREGVGTLMEAFPLDTVTGGFLHSDIAASG